MLIHFFAKWGYLIRLIRHWMLRNLLMSQALQKMENKSIITIPKLNKILQHYWIQTSYPSVRMAYLYFVPSSLSWSQSTTRWRTSGNGSASSTIFCSTKHQHFSHTKTPDHRNITLISNKTLWYNWAQPTCVIPVNFTQKSESCGFSSGFTYSWKVSTWKINEKNKIHKYKTHPAG